MSPTSRRLAGLVVCLSFCFSLSALAQSSPDAGSPSTPPDAGTPPEEDAGVSAEDLKAIEEALGKDTAAAAASGAAAGTPSEPTSSSSGVTISPSNINIKGLDLSFILDVAAAAFSSKEPLQTGGHDPTNNGFNFQQLEMSVNTAVDPYFRFNSNIVFSQFGVEVEEAYATTTALPANLQVRAGQFLTRFGRLNPTHPHTWDFVDQPFAIGRIFGSEGNRGLGVEGSWLSPLPWYLEVVGSVTDATGEGTARSFLGSAGGGVTSPFDFQFTGAVKQFFPLSDDLSLLWGLSAANGPNPTGYHNRTDVFGTDVYLKYRPVKGGSTTLVTLQAELFYRRRQVPQDVLSDFDGYGQILWRFSQRWAAAGRYEFGTPAHNRNGAVANDPLDPEWTANRQRLSANVTFWPTEFSRLRLQGATDLAGWRDHPDYSVFLALEVVMGAHGAHSF
ncbi:zinc-regulated TonB-dependent outer membrane receptor [Vitiosangium sp. GDMCC 1.1324]|uniref:zinc-regulated TonB-dependent outer membrane receptor n=1 Tax=Vitiosangium sp. (strain GDMCC 1.1324) TaxID=2138576 RepID=UPI000D3B6E63|nr:zinc-regulated TonB-dependent outer membrane receptor [Vitiosangium sp. GDMCC 1.1324]PTL78215.1 zinc-regulated TonB-dependent outer membrane receptor [Vitiosangium sp. GDMCC 1.1324]